MAATGHLSGIAHAPSAWSVLSEPRRVMWLRLILIVVIVAIWEAVAASGLLFRDVVPSLVTIGRSLLRILFYPDFTLMIGSTDIWIPEFYRHLWVTCGEVAGAMSIGGLAGLAVGLLLGTTPF